MSNMRQLRSCDIPQADTLKTVRQVLCEIAKGNTTVAGIHEETGVSERHIQYRLQTARILGLCEAKNVITQLGNRLLKTTEGTPEESALWRRVILACPTVKQLVPFIFGKEEIDRIELATRIETATGMSPETAKRRMTVFCSWRRQLKH